MTTFRAAPCELSCRYRNPHQVEEFIYVMTSLDPWHRRPPVWQLASRDRNKLTLELKIDCTWNKMTDLKTTYGADRAVSAWSPLSQPKKSLTPLLFSCGELAFGQMSPVSTPHQAASIWNEANFPFHQPGLFVGFWAAGSWSPHLSVTAASWKAQ